MQSNTTVVLAKTAAILLLLAFVSGCAGVVTKQVSESDKDPSNSFDGTYLGVVKHPGGRQEMGSGWYTQCSARDFKARVTVRKSAIKWQWDDDNALTGFVDSEGRFRIEHELERKTTGRGSVMSDGTVTAVLQGDLRSKTMKGRFVFAVAQFAGNGCTYPVNFERA